mgnify:CR=1 FL=1
MAGITLAQAEAQLSAWLEASTSVASNQSYSINGRSLTRADAGEIRDQIDFWQNWVTKLDSASRGVRRVRYGVAR